MMVVAIADVALIGTAVLGRQAVLVPKAGAWGCASMVQRVSALGHRLPNIKPLYPQVVAVHDHDVIAQLRNMGNCPKLECLLVEPPSMALGSLKVLAAEWSSAFINPVHLRHACAPMQLEVAPARAAVQMQGTNGSPGSRLSYSMLPSSTALRRWGEPPNLQRVGYLRVALRADRM